MRAAGAEPPNSDRAKACCHEKARQGRGGVFARPCCTMRRTESAVFAHVFRFLWLRCRFDLKPVAGMTVWNEKCGRDSIGNPPRSVKATVLRTEESIP